MGLETSDLNAKLKFMQVRIDELERGLVERSNEVDDGRAPHSKLIELVESTAFDLATKSKEVTVHAATVSALTAQRKKLQNLVRGLQEELKRKDAQWKCLEERLLKHITILESKLLSVKKKNSDLVQHNDILISQYNCPLLGNDTYKRDNMLPRCRSVDREEDQTDKLRIENKEVNNEFNDGHVNVKVKEESVNDDHLEHDKQQKLLKCSQSCPSNSREFITPTSDNRKGSSPFGGTKKRPASGWIETRSHTNRSGPDPHDDFLDIPFENIKVNMNKARIEEIEGLYVNVPKEINNFSNDEMPHKSMDLHPLKQPMATAFDGKKTFKHVESVRKKADRDNLKGIEYAQCKKFYEAVLPDIDDKSGSRKTGVRCEHHHGVSRHRYKYVPPMTPERFWNIGFESEM